LYALADIIRGHKQNQDQFARQVVRPASSLDFSGPKGASFPIPAIVVLISLALGEQNSSFSIRAAATYAFQVGHYAFVLLHYLINLFLHSAMFSKTPTANWHWCPPCAHLHRTTRPQMTLQVETFPTFFHISYNKWSTAMKVVSAGSYIVSTLLNWKEATQDPYRTWFAANIFSYLLNSNEQCKEIAMTFVYGGSLF
jgi:hypothetical protein